MMLLPAVAAVADAAAAAGLKLCARLSRSPRLVRGAAEGGAVAEQWQAHETQLRYKPRWKTTTQLRVSGAQQRGARRSNTLPHSRNPKSQWSPHCELALAHRHATGDEASVSRSRSCRRFHPAVPPLHLVRCAHTECGRTQRRACHNDAARDASADQRGRDRISRACRSVSVRVRVSGARRVLCLFEFGSFT